ncbi:O-antigen/teichoic acid export membrane protein [Spirosoma lacussanchae]|uniref:MATE family efflux transporter n=1 Tax=Spirosoma lacussanchae TaxID=1884249 RepID=UPI0011082DBD|nr:MATE family efflux transporter [Spirosoma lacussanchae]
MQAANRVIKNTGILYARMAITVFISLYATRLLLAALGTENFGIFNVVGGMIAMLTFLNTAMTSATQRFMSYTEGSGDLQRLKKIFNVSLILHLSIAILLFIAIEAVGHFLFDGILTIPETRLAAAKWVFHFSVVSTLFTILAVPYDATVNAHENMIFYAIVGVIETVAKLGIAIFITYTSDDKLIIYGLLTCLLSVALLAFRVIYCHKKFSECEINPRKYFDKEVYREMTGFAGWSFLGSSSSIVANYGQSVLINIFFGPTVNAAQTISGQVSGQLGVFATVMLKAINPLITKSEGSGDRSMMLKASFMGSKMSFFLLMLLYVPVLIEMPYIFSLWLKEVPDYTVIFCRILLIRNLIEQLFLTLTSSIAAVGKIRKYQIYSSISNILPLVATYALFSLGFPPYILYISFTSFTIISSGIILLFSRKYFNLSITDYLNSVVFKCFICLAIVFIPCYVISLLTVEGVMRLIAITLTSSLLFTVVIWSIGLSASERSYAKDTIEKGITSIKLIMNKSLLNAK